MRGGKNKVLQAMAYRVGHRSRKSCFKLERKIAVATPPQKKPGPDSFRVAWVRVSDC